MPLLQLPTRLRRAMYVVIGALSLTAAIPLLDIAPLRARIAKDATESLGRRLEIGTLRLAMLPRPGITLENATLYEPDGKTPFMSFDSARLSLGWTALTHRNAEFVDARIEGLKLKVVSLPNGKLNCDDLLNREPKSDRVQWRLTRIDLVAASMDWLGLDRQVTRFSGIDLHALNPESDEGGITLEGRVAAPDWGGGLRIDSGLKYYRSQQTAKLPDFRLGINALTNEWREGKVQFNGEVAIGALPWRVQAGKVIAKASAKRADQLWQLGITTPDLRFGEVGLSTGAMQAQFQIKSPQREITGNVDIEKLAAEAPTGNLLADRAAIQIKLMDDVQNATLQLQSPLRIDGWRKLKLGGFTLSGSYRHRALPRGAIKLDLAGNTAVDLSRERIDVQGQGNLDNANLTATFSLEDFLLPRYAFGLELARLDLTPYLPAADAATGIDTASPIDWESLSSLNARGDLKLGELDVGRFKVRDLKTHIEAADRKLALNPLSADIYGGRLKGSLTVDITKTPTLQIHQQLTGMQIDTLLGDALGINRVTGRGNLKLDLTTQAESLDSARKQLNGRVELSLTRGAIAGFDVGDMLRGLRANLAKLTGMVLPADVTRQTRFSSLKASFAIKDGVAASNDLKVAAPFVDLGGTGSIDLGRSQIDYRLLATVLGATGVPELDLLKGIDIPIYIAGSLTAPNYRVDTSAIKARLAVATAPNTMQQPAAATATIKREPPVGPREPRRDNR